MKGGSGGRAIIAAGVFDIVVFIFRLYSGFVFTKSESGVRVRLLEQITEQFIKSRFAAHMLRAFLCEINEAGIESFQHFDSRSVQSEGMPSCSKRAAHRSQGTVVAWISRLRWRENTVAASEDE